jgi:SNF2 family DNA or RNA helicase
MQSEDRCHRIGTVNNVVYWDLIGEDTIDEKIARSNAMKSHLADVVIDRKKV